VSGWREVRRDGSEGKVLAAWHAFACMRCAGKGVCAVDPCGGRLGCIGAQVHVYTDGTALVTHGGVEMGQGLHTKVAQVGARGGWPTWSSLTCGIGCSVPIWQPYTE
jgi:Molybdopterin-binding domain of aldehyde dehydrogenase